jgi:hypothetical protein
MPDQLVTVARYFLAYEADLARNMLESEGIRAFVNGHVTGGLLPTGEIQLQVAANDAPRAAALLAAQAAAALDDNWEERAESGAGVWKCSLCGEPVPEQATACRSCGTPRDAIRAAPGRDIQREAPSPDSIRARDQVTALPAPAVALDEEEKSPSPTDVDDNPARRPFGATAFGIAVVVLLLLGFLAVIA